MQTPHPPITKGHVLLVEDSAWEAHHMFDAWPENSPAQLHHVRTAEDALTWFTRNGLPHLVLLDIDLPGMSGLDLLRALRVSATTRALPIIILSSSHSGSTIHEAYRLGANGYIRKPLSMRSLRDMLQQLNVYWFIVSAVPESTVTAVDEALHE